LLREVALHLKNRGLDIQSFAPLVRLRHVLEEEMEWISDVRPGQEGRKELGEGNEQEQHGNSCYSNCDNDDLDQSTEKRMESLIMSLEVLCYKENLSVKQFFDCIHGMYLIAEKLGILIEDIPDYIKQQEVRIQTLL
jgi:hypothetical protein